MPRPHARHPFGVQLSLKRRSSLRRTEWKPGRLVNLSWSGALVSSATPLEVGEWVTVELPETAEHVTPSERRILPTGATRGRVVREAATDDPQHPFGFGIEFPRDRMLLFHSLIDLCIPWMAVASIVAILLHVFVLKGLNVYFFWYQPWVNFYSLMISFYIVSRVVIACAYKAAPDAGFRPTATVIVACKNEAGSIRRTLDCIFRSDYPGEKLQVIVVDDGSTDGTLPEIRRAKHEHKRLEVIRFKKNRGKRQAMAAAARRATGDVLVYVDSDSFLRRDALARLVADFEDPIVGAVCGHARVHNARVNFLTKMQEVRYYVAFRIVKAAESVFSAVTCCSGCLAAYRRSYVMEVLEPWTDQRFLGTAATFGDDRSLTNHMLRRYKVRYNSEAVCGTIVPESIGTFLRQQLRWKKSWIRESLIALTFIWKRHPFIAFFFALGVLFPLVSPAIVFHALIFPWLGVGSFSTLYIYGTVLMATLYGLIYLARHRNILWIYGIVFSLFYMFVLVWQTYYALATVRRNHWGTR